MFLLLKALLEKDDYCLDDFLNVRSDPVNKKGFFQFFDKFVTCVAGRKNWTPAVKVNMPLSNCNKVSISDEAFAEIVLINYWNRWVHNKSTKWTDNRNGNVEYQGWNPLGHLEYNKIYKRIKSQRENPSLSELVDTLFLQQAAEEYKNLVFVETDNSSYVPVEEACMDDF